MNRARRRLLLAILALIGLGGLTVVANQAGLDILGPGKVDHIRLAAYDGDVGALEWIARDKGFFRKVGLEVDMKAYPSGNAAMEALRAGEVDIATAADLVVAKRSFTEPDLRILADICRYWNKGLVARRDRNILVPGDLRGKRIGVPATSSAEHNLMVFLALQGLSMRDVTIVDLAPKPLVEAVTAGQIDAAIVWQPHVTAIEKALGANAVRLMDGGTEAHLLLVTREAEIAPRADAIRKLLKGLILAEQWVRANPDQAKATLAERFALDPAYLDILWPRMQLAVSLPQEILAAMEAEARWLAQADTKGTRPTFADTIHPEPLRAVKPDAVGIFTR
ncbi:ABC transporter substrate-binding protein [Magnetospirillum moscoviense]|uniref:Solute-binding protein family 3/N-terminal domain-containing protein n=1 Tax=Magnetospirillum moscoviense TaxID=1437059 RepID=A0A178ML57_9PROT|nr:ABC transporter substrate-binding protein [Magnetospirillum moscoviense]MBF0325310.1 ABC transporter substrate-binding protein [Alphaproteobacteria bacterium]OAN49339.1 hypothetical protein A6A05_14125 [Magnetospirillum moscoviense]